MIRVLVIEDHPITRVGIKADLNPLRDDIKVMGEFNNVDDVILNQDSSSVDVIILDLWIPGSKPLENVRTLKRHFPGRPILIYTGEDSREWKSKMIHAGVEGYISKGSTKPELIVAIKRIYEHGYYYQTITDSPKPNNFYNYDPKKFKILVLLSNGFLIKEIANVQQCSSSTIEKILKEIRDEYGVANNIQLSKEFILKYFA